MMDEPVKHGVRDIELQDFSLNGLNKPRLRDPEAAKNNTTEDNGIYPENPLPDEKLSSTSTLSSKQHVSMKKDVGLLSGVALIVGTMIGKLVK